MRYVPYFVLAALLMACSLKKEHPVGDGLSQELAQLRSNSISRPRYDVFLDIPKDKAKPVTGEVKLRFELSEIRYDLAVDFKPGAGHVIEVLKRGTEPVEFRYEDEHIIIPFHYLQLDENRFTIRFRSSDVALHRNKGFLYSLFVPDKASTAIPCFDQPDLKARWYLTLRIPKTWEAVSNGVIVEEKPEGQYKRVEFGYSDIIPSYLFSFVAGDFRIKTSTQDDRKVRFFYRPADSVQVAQHARQIFSLTFEALRFYESYTGLPYPFQKYDFVAIPSFPYSGMEHPGATLFRASRLLPGKSPTIRQKLARADLIAHEIAHNWFGNAVTITWFDEVWVKELFATFLADKFVQERFRPANHGLSFMLKHHPRAYALDRTQGAMPIARNLPNLNQAGQLYDAIIYHKAPIAMAQLEKHVGPDTLQRAIQRFARQNFYGNARWQGFIRTLDSLTSYPIADWNKRWVHQAGMPKITAQWQQGGINIIPKKENMLPQHLQAAVFFPDSIVRKSFFIDSGQVLIPLPGMRPEAWLPDISPTGYGYFEPGTDGIAFLTQNLMGFPVAVRGAAWLHLYEAFLRGKVPFQAFSYAITQALNHEKEPLILDYLFENLHVVYWQFASPTARKKWQRPLENALLQRVLGNESEGLRKGFMKAYAQIAQSKQAVAYLQKWQEANLSPVSLGAQERLDLVLQLALRKPGQAQNLLARFGETLDDPHLREQVAFLRPAFAQDTAGLSRFFGSFAKPAARSHEKWALQAVRLMKHPLRNHPPQFLLQNGLDLFPGMARSGNVFFGENWLAALMQYRNSRICIEIIQQFLVDNPELSVTLKNKILQQADLCSRAAPENETFKK